MHRGLRVPRPSPAMVVACIALLVALSGTGVATISAVVPDNTVGTSQIKDNAVTSAKVRDFSLRLWDFKQGQLPRGPAGPAGPPGVIKELIPHQSSVSVPGNRVNGAFVTRSIHIRCASGEHAISGGASWSSEKDDEQLITVYSRPIVEKSVAVGWRARGGSDVSVDRLFTVQVLCVKS